MRDPPGSREWQDYYDNQKTYIPPSYSTQTTPVYPRAHSPPILQRRSSSNHYTPVSREQGPGQGSRWNLFEGMTIYIHPRENESSHEVRRRLDLMDNIKYHGGSLSLKPNSPYVTTILVPFPPTYPRYTVLLIEPPSRTPNIGEWTRDQLVQHLAKVSTTDNSPVYQYGRKRVLRIEWAEEGLRDGRLRGANKSWGGWEVRATYDPKLVNDRNSYQTSSSDFGVNENLSQQEDDRLEARFQLSPDSSTAPAEHVETLAQDPRKYLRAKADQTKGGVVGGREKTIGSTADERRLSQEEAKGDRAWEEASISIEEPMLTSGTDATDLPRSNDSQRERSFQIEDIQIDELRANNGEQVERSQAHGLKEPEGVHTINTGEKTVRSGEGIIVDIHVKEEIRKQVNGDKEVTSNYVKDEKESQPKPVEVKPEDGDSIIRPGGSKIEETEDGTEGNDNVPKQSQNDVGDNEKQIEYQRDGTIDIKPVIIDDDEEPSKGDIRQSSFRSQSRSRSVESRSFSRVRCSSQGSHKQSTRSSASEASTATAVSAPTRGPSSPTASRLGAIPTVEKKVFARGVLLPYTFCVLGEGREKRFTEMIITNAGGIISSSGSAIFLIVLLSPDQCGTLADRPEVYRMVRKIQSEPGRRAVSVDWVEDCIERDTLLPLDGYVMVTVEERSAEMITPPPSGSGSSDSGGKKRDGGARDGREGSKKKSRT